MHFVIPVKTGIQARILTWIPGQAQNDEMKCGSGFRVKPGMTEA